MTMQGAPQSLLQWSPHGFKHSQQCQVTMDALGLEARWACLRDRTRTSLCITRTIACDHPVRRSVCLQSGLVCMACMAHICGVLKVRELLNLRQDCEDQHAGQRWC